MKRKMGRLGYLAAWLVLLVVYSRPCCCRYRFEKPSRVVEIKHGRIQGVLTELPFTSNLNLEEDSDLKEDSFSHKVEVFKGVPFAAPPLGSLRFMPPVTVTPWKDIRSTSDFGPVCPQLLPDVRNESSALQTMSRGRFWSLRQLKPLLANQSEDCLYLNVYAPHTGARDEQEKLKPVVLFIHGDDYEWGSGNIYDGSILASVGKLVVVTLNYRLGLLGFLNANLDGKSRNPANLGILDQIAALHWVQENIVHFGGDARNVTLMGHGTGAACVHFLMTSEALPEGKLFHRVILMSGSALASWATVRNPDSATRQVAAFFNCSLDVSENVPGRHQSLLQCLRSVPLYQLMRVKVDRPSAFKPIWGPSFDGVVVHSFRNRIRDYLERMARYELLLGVASADALFHFNDKELEYGIESEGRNRILSNFVSSNYELHQREIFSAIVTEYTDWQNPSRHPVNIRDLTLDALTDSLYVAPMVETGDYHSSLSTKSWFYVFEYQTKNSYYKQRQGCAHGEDLHYVFGTPLLQIEPRNSNNFSRSEASLARKVIGYWSNFAATGDPNGDQSRGRPNPEWERYDPKHKKYLWLGSKPRTRDHYRSRQMALWLNLLPDLSAAATAARGRQKVPEVLYDSKSDQILTYKSYDELLPFVPKLKNVPQLVANVEETTPASSEVLDHGRSNASLSGQSRPAQGAQWRSSLDEALIGETNNGSSRQANVLQGVQAEARDALGGYSTALGATVAIGCSLLVLNLLAFAALYYKRDRGRDNPDSETAKLDDSLTLSVTGSAGSGNNVRNNRRPPLNSMNSISQYVERKPAGPMTSPDLANLESEIADLASRRNLRDAPSSTLVPLSQTGHGNGRCDSVPPRKSALKQSLPSTFRPSNTSSSASSSTAAHLPPPEFADGPLQSSCSSPPCGPASSNFLSLPRRPSSLGSPPHTHHHPKMPQHAFPRQTPPHTTITTTTTTTHATSNASNHGENVRPGCTQTLPLKSNLKKSSVIAAAPVNASSSSHSGFGGCHSYDHGRSYTPHKLQWREASSSTTVSTASLDELRV